MAGSQGTFLHGTGLISHSFFDPFICKKKPGYKISTIARHQIQNIEKVLIFFLPFCDSKSYEFLFSFFKFFISPNYLLFLMLHFWRWHFPVCWWHCSSRPQHLTCPSGESPSGRKVFLPQSASSGSKGPHPWFSPSFHCGTMLWWVWDCHLLGNSRLQGCLQLDNHFVGVPEFADRHLGQLVRHLKDNSVIFEFTDLSIFNIKS